MHIFRMRLMAAPAGHVTAPKLRKVGLSAPKSVHIELSAYVELKSLAKAQLASFDSRTRRATRSGALLFPQYQLRDKGCDSRRNHAHDKAEKQAAENRGHPSARIGGKPVFDAEPNQENQSGKTR